MSRLAADIPLKVRRPNRRGLAVPDAPPPKRRPDTGATWTQAKARAMARAAKGRKA
jgi:hypothetical protein